MVLVKSVAKQDIYFKIEDILSRAQAGAQQDEPQEHVVDSVTRCTYSYLLGRFFEADRKSA
jgi:hypothetical protein